MSSFKWLASAVLATVISPELHSEPHCPGNVAILRFRLVLRSQIIVPVTINHAGPYDFLVDTGAQITIVDPALAAELQLKIEGTTGLVGVGFRTRPSFAHLDTLEVGSHAMANPPVVIQNMELQAADPHIRGVLGGDFLRKFDVLIDYARGMLCLDDAKVMRSEIKGKHIALVSLPHPDGGVISTEPLIIQVHLSGIPSRPLFQLLDSGANVPLLYDPGEAKVGGFSVSAPIRDRGPDGVKRIFTVLPPQDMRIGTLTLHQISFFFPLATGKDIPKVEGDGILPTALFRRVYISYADRFVVLDPW
jgi:hypothetical protein